MHVAIAKTALEIIRDLRHQCAEHPFAWFAPVVQESRVIQLSLVQETRGFPANKLDAPSSIARGQADTLFESRFPFGLVESNLGIDLSELVYFDSPFDRDNPLMLGVFEKAKMHARKSIETRLISRHLPSNALVSLGPRTWFVSPELTIIQLAKDLDHVLLAAIIMELAGSYSLAPLSREKIATRFGLPPVTSIDAIRKMAAAMPRVSGRATLAKALSLAMEGSASPKETQIAIMARLPVPDGGYGLEAPLLNARLSIPRNIGAHMSRETYFPDLYFSGFLTCIEYDSDMFHANGWYENMRYGGLDSLSLAKAASSEKLANDRRRIRELQMMGIAVVPMTSKDLLSVSRLDRAMVAVFLRREREGGMMTSECLLDLGEQGNRAARERVFELLSSRV